MLLLLTIITYNEIIYLDEWIDFHKKQGVEKIYIGVYYKTNKKNKIFQELIEKYKNDTIITFNHLKFNNFIHITHFFENYYEKHINDWLSIIDIDEFLYSPLENKKITDIIEIYEKEKKYAIGVNWKCFGSNNIDKNPQNEVLKKFTKCSDKYFGCNQVIKSLFKLVSIKKNITNTHKYPLKKGYRYYTSTGLDYIQHNRTNFEKLKLHREEYLQYINKIDKNIVCDNKYLYNEENPWLTINHYILRSKQEYQYKIDNNPDRKDRYNLNNFNNLNKVLNVRTDTTILQKL